MPVVWTQVRGTKNIIRSHTEEPRRIATICMRPLFGTVCNRGKEKNHMAVTHGQEKLAVKKHVCGKCLERFASKYALQTHRYKEHPSKVSLRCEVCLAVFRATHTFKAHNTPKSNSFISHFATFDKGIFEKQKTSEHSSHLPFHSYNSISIF